MCYAVLRPGAKVLFAAEPTDKPVQGTVAKIELIGTYSACGYFCEAHSAVL
jgi:hypothetical protein